MKNNTYYKQIIKSIHVYLKSARWHCGYKHHIHFEDFYPKYEERLVHRVLQKLARRGVIYYVPKCKKSSCVKCMRESACKAVEDGR